jgi:hypothetical protein
MRPMLQVFTNTLFGAEADAVRGAAYRGVSDERVNCRTGTGDRLHRLNPTHSSRKGRDSVEIRAGRST